MKIETINEIIALAIAANNKKSKPGEFARAAAHKAALDAASQHSQDLADFATLAAASIFYIEVTKAIVFSSKVTDKAVNRVDANNQYQAEWEKYSTTIIPTHVTDNYFHSLAEAPDKISKAFLETVTPTYDNTSVLDVVAKNKAKRAALYVYINTYAIARAAYIQALFVANYHGGHNQAELFRKTITKRLKKDLTFDQINPGFILKLLSTIICRALLAIVLLASITGILLACFHLTPLPFIPLICASSAASAGSIGLLAGGFFAVKKCKEIYAENDSRAELAVVV
ncbi:MAG: hypothetical protein P1U74_00260 [Legionellaceae bacterium]|nr:hypothetical protein [Legionellaceae bacterium]